MKPAMRPATRLAWTPAMIPRHQAILLTLLLLASLGMGIGLWHSLKVAHERLLQGMDSAPTRAPQVAPVEQATLMVANDADNTLLTQVHSLPLLDDPGSRARAVLGRLLDLYASPNSTHPVPGGAASIAQVFLMPVSGAAAIADTEPQSINQQSANPNRKILRLDAPSAQAAATPAASRDQSSTAPLMAVVNLTGSFAADHPSGLETESLTVLSICATLHANLPRIAQVRFLVDGQVRPTLAGHADLTRTYLTTEGAGAASSTMVQPTGNP